MTLMDERTATSDTAPPGFEDMLDVLDELHVPDGFRAEIIRGNIVVSPWSKAYYLDVMDLVCDRLRPHLPDGHRLSSSPALYVFPGVERGYGPDVNAADARARRTTSHRLDGVALSLVVELTSPSTRDDDFHDKVKQYGRAGVPVYLLLDMQEEQVIVFSMPSAAGYGAHEARPFGEKVHIPAPFDCTLDTSGFAAPAE
ncbi:Uma2 family endonuclease [Streptomyces sp. NPDC093225]|uniref:Uma2 family endonuclease n=1 Tax=Streptomyces sp. NPDC093225 TaxID=3366034 RepID=UPI00380A5F50